MAASKLQFRLTAAAVAAIVTGTPAGVPAQPAPSFQARCGELRKSVRDLNFKHDQLVVIEVVGTLTLVQSDGALAYLGVCKPPDPQVLCVTYSTNGRKVGDEVVVTGSLIPHGPDYIQLDPCLHHLPE